MNIVLMGCPGAGKGTQSAKMQDKFHLYHISTGDVLRAEIAKGSELGKEIAGIINKGNLVPDALMISMLENIVKSTDKGIIFDGFPRTVAQAEALDSMMKRLNRKVTHVIMITLPEEEIISRITSRRQCKKCGEIYHVDPSSPLPTCKACGGELYTRADDTAERVKHRIDVYHQETLPVKDYYKNSGVYKEVDGHQTPDQVFAEISNILEEGAK
ncbi:adenylate kinase [Candidatus Avelusimicrobium aviculae]|uniref:adenylate kinase n=1 Tax=Candidatus Avelusimicrobium aviculae TaxID=3416206 RepID=UPI003D0B38A1